MRSFDFTPEEDRSMACETERRFNRTKSWFSVNFSRSKTKALIKMLEKLKYSHHTIPFHVCETRCREYQSYYFNLPLFFKKKVCCRMWFCATHSFRAIFEKLCSVPGTFLEKPPSRSDISCPKGRSARKMEQERLRHETTWRGIEMKMPSNFNRKPPFCSQVLGFTDMNTDYFLMGKREKN